MSVAADPVVLATETQSLVQAGIEKMADRPAPRHRLADLIEAMAGDTAAIAATVGPAGIKFKETAGAIDPDHPDVGVTLDARAGDYKELVSAVKGTLDLHRRGEPLDAAKAVFEADSPVRGLLDLLAWKKPRLLKDEGERKRARGAKGVVTVSVQRLLQGDENGFYIRPADFRLFARFSQHFVSVTEQLEARRLLLHSHKMPEQAKAQRQRIEDVHSYLANPYLGFFRVRPTDAAIVLAKMSGFTLTDGAVSIRAKSLKSPVWSQPDDGGRGEYIAEVTKSAEFHNFMVQRKSGNAVDLAVLTYNCRMYPPHLWPIQASGLAAEALQRVERLRDIDGKCAFDYYWIMVPGVGVQHPIFVQDKDFVVKNGDVVTKTRNAADAQLLADVSMVQQGNVAPIILGERDGLTYFISMFE